MKKTNILIIVDKFDYHGSYINGPSRYFSWIASEIDKKKFNVTLCALRPKGKSDDFLSKENINVKYLGLGKFNPFTFLFISKLLVTEKIDIVHLTGYGSTTFGRIACFLCNKPAIIQEHWVDPDIKKIQIIFEKIFNPLTDHAIAISEYAKKFLIEKKGIKSNKIIVIPNGIPLSRFRISNKEKGLEKKAELGFSPETKVVGTIGMLHYNKGHKYFIRAAHLLKNKFPNLKFVIIGDGEMRNELEKLVAELDLREYVIFLGQRTDIPELLNMLDIYVLSSNSETAPLSLLEAMSAGKAIITTDCGGPGEVIKQGETGFIVPIKDHTSISEKIIFLLQKPNEIERLGCNALKDSERYDINLTIRKLEEFYLKVKN